MVNQLRRYFVTRNSQQGQNSRLIRTNRSSVQQSSGHIDTTNRVEHDPISQRSNILGVSLRSSNSDDLFVGKCSDIINTPKEDTKVDVDSVLMQNEFLEKTNAFTAELCQLLSGNAMPEKFSDVTEKIRQTRLDIAQINNIDSVYIRNNSTNDFTTTYLSARKYSKQSINALKNIKNNADMLFSLPNIHGEIPFLADNKYFIFKPIYKKNPALETTHTYIAQGKILISCGKYNAVCHLDYERNYKKFEKAPIIKKKYDALLDAHKKTYLSGKRNIRKCQLDFMKQFSDDIQKNRDFLIALQSDTDLIDENKDKEFNTIIHDNNTITRVQVLHTNSINVQANLDEINNEYQEYKRNKKEKNTKDAFDNVCNMVYLFANSCPFNRGSAWGSEVIASAFLRDLFKDEKISFVASDLDFQCFSQPSDKFVTYMTKTLEDKYKILVPSEF